MGKTYTVNLDLDDLKKIFSRKKPNCKACGCKVKIYKEKVFERHGNYETKGYVGNINRPKISIFKRKEIYFNQDIYRVIYKYKCTSCNKIYDLNEL